jgi:hypothetical protein
MNGAGWNMMKSLNNFSLLIGVLMRSPTRRERCSVHAKKGVVKNELANFICGCSLIYYGISNILFSCKRSQFFLQSRTNIWFCILGRFGFSCHKENYAKILISSLPGNALFSRWRNERLHLTAIA